jgi:hypothetical protein
LCEATKTDVDGFGLRVQAMLFHAGRVSAEKRYPKVRCDSAPARPTGAILVIIA